MVRTKNIPMLNFHILKFSWDYTQTFAWAFQNHWEFYWPFIGHV